MQTKSTPSRGNLSAKNRCQALVHRSSRLMLPVTGAPAFLKAISTFESA